MPEIITIKAPELKLAGTGFTALKKTSRMTRENWLELRRKYIGGSDMASLCFPDDNGGPLTVHMSKVTGSDSFEGNDYTDYGTIMEEVIGNVYIPTYLVRHGLTVNDFKVYTSPWFYVSTKHKWMAANIDGVLDLFKPLTLDHGTVVPPGRYVLEKKTAGFAKAKDWKGNELPARYYAQPMQYVECVGLAGAAVFGLIDRTPVLRYLPRNQKFIDEVIIPKGAEAWGRVERNDPPFAFGGDADLDALRVLYPEAEGKTFVEKDGISEHASMYLTAKERLDDWKKIKDAEEAWLKSSIGEELGVKEGVLASAKWTRWSSEVFDQKAFKAKHPKLASKFTRKQPGQKLTVKVQGFKEEED